MSSYLDCFKEEMNTSVVITGNGAETSRLPDNTPVYTTVTKYNDYCAFYMLTSSEKLECSKLNYPASHNMILYPDKELITIQPGDIATIDSKEYTIYPGENTFNLNDVLIFKVGIKND